MRHELVQRIVKAYADYESRKKNTVRERPVRPTVRAERPEAPRTFRRRLEGKR